MPQDMLDKDIILPKKTSSSDNNEESEKEINRKLKKERLRFYKQARKYFKKKNELLELELKEREAQNNESSHHKTADTAKATNASKNENPSIKYLKRFFCKILNVVLDCAVKAIGVFVSNFLNKKLKNGFTKCPG